MKYYSETLKKLFETEAELNEAESRQKKLDLEEQERKNKISAEKKIAATKVQLATEAYDKATEEYEVKKKEILNILDKAEAEAAKIIEKANAEAEAALKDAENDLRDARISKYNAIAEFNKSYGPYKTTITKEAAEKEFNRFSSDIDTWLNKLLRSF